jgi:phosphoserine phosphatase RsbU/P
MEGFCVYVNLTATALQKVRALERQRQQERVDRDLAIASEIQSELLSRAIPEHVPGAHFAAFNRPAAIVGGDFYDVFVKNPYEIYFAIGDVSGKGISAALLMAQVLSAMQFVFTTATSPADALAKLNATLHERIVRGLFVTMLIGRFTPTSGQVELASAGHCRPYMLRSTGRTFQVQTEAALPLGILPNIPYRQGKIDIATGDHLICFTDGLSESRAQESDAFFEDRIEASLKSLDSSSSPAAIIEGLVHAEESHRGRKPRSDDLTLLVLVPQ